MDTIARPIPCHHRVCEISGEMLAAVVAVARLYPKHFQPIIRASWNSNIYYRAGIGEWSCPLRRLHDTEVGDKFLEAVDFDILTNAAHREKLRELLMSLAAA